MLQSYGCASSKCMVCKAASHREAQMMLVQMLNSTILKPPTKFLKFWLSKFGAVSDF